MPLTEEQYDLLDRWMRGEAHDLERLREELHKVIQFANLLQQVAQAQPEISYMQPGVPEIVAKINDATAIYSASIYAQVVLNAKGSLKLLDYAQEHYRDPVLKRKKD